MAKKGRLYSSVMMNTMWTTVIGGLLHLRGPAGGGAAAGVVSRELHGAAMSVTLSPSGTLGFQREACAHPRLQPVRRCGRAAVAAAVLSAAVINLRAAAPSEHT